MKIKSTLLLLFVSQFFFAQSSKKIQAFHVINNESDKDLIVLAQQLPQLAAQGINTLFLEVDYNFEFDSHPELRGGDSPITKAGAKSFAKACAANNIELIPEFQSVGHQSWKENTFGLLKTYPELDLTPNAFPKNESIYCREWDVTNPKVNQIIFPLIDEIVSAFGAKGIHVGMDEVFLLGTKESPNSFGKNNAQLFAKAINEFHQHFVKEKKLQMYIWGDRLIDANTMNYGIWEASACGTSPAIDSIPKDIIICDWHYNSRSSYPSVDLFLQKGFKVLPCSYKDVDAANTFIKYTYSLQNPNMIGHCFTTWGSMEKTDVSAFPALIEGIKTIKEEKFFDVKIEYLTSTVPGQIALKLNTTKPSLRIHYTLDGSEPTTNSPVFKDILYIKENSTLNALTFNNEKPAGSIISETFSLHKGIGLPIELLNTPSTKYLAINGKNALLNGISGSASFGDGQWLAFENSDAAMVIQTNNIEINKITMTFHNQVNAWIHHPQDIEIFTSEDGVNFISIKKQHVNKIGRQTVSVSIPLPAVKSNYIKIVAQKVIIPEGFNGEGNGAWIFMDEIILE